MNKSKNLFYIFVLKKRDKLKLLITSTGLGNLDVKSVILLFKSYFIVEIAKYFLSYWYNPINS